MKNITYLIAHPDDEVIFGSVLLSRAKKIICCSSDLNNPERQWCKDRKLALQEIGKLFEAEIICLDYNSEFYRLPTRSGELNKLVDTVLELINKEEFIFTHNPWGEYGHLDHILVHQIARASGRLLAWTDICLEAGWWNCRPNLIGEKVESCEVDSVVYNKCKKIYDKYGCWTWSKESVWRFNIYESHQRHI